MMGDLPGYGPIWYDWKAIANVLSLYNVRKKYHIAYDSQKSHSFIVAKPTGEQFHFLELGTGLHYLDTLKHKETNQYCTKCDDDESGHVLMLDTVSNKQTNYTNNDYLHAKRAQELQIKIGRPSTKDYLQILNTNALLNCPVTTHDILAAEDIFGQDIGSLKEKTT